MATASMNPKQALAILNEARAAGFYDGSVPEDQELLATEAGIIVEEAKAAEKAKVKSDVVGAILYIARVDHNPAIEAQTALDLDSAAKVGAHTQSPTAADLGQDSTSSQPEVAQDRSQDSNDDQASVAPDDDEQGQLPRGNRRSTAPLSHHYIARAEAIARIKKERLPIPPELDGEPPVLPRDMTKLSDTQLRRLNSELNAAFARANYIASIEAADEYAAKMIGDKLFIRALARAASGEERRSEATRRAEADAADDVREWRDKASDHHIKARIYKDLRDGLKDALDRISREWSMRIGERQHA